MDVLHPLITVDDAIEVTSEWLLPSGFKAHETTAVVLAHGAGNDMRDPFLSCVHRACAHAGHLSIKFNFPYKEMGRKAPDPSARLEATWRAVIARVNADEALAPRAVYAGGKSMGGRIASRIVASGERVGGLIFLAYPLHAAKRPERLRDAHFAAIDCPTLFIEGDRDPLCDLALLETSRKKLAAASRLHVIRGADHSFRVLKALARSETEVWDEIVAVVLDWIAETASDATQNG